MQYQMGRGAGAEGRKEGGGKKVGGKKDGRGGKEVGLCWTSGLLITKITMLYKISIVIVGSHLLSPISFLAG